MRSIKTCTPNLLEFLDYLHCTCKIHGQGHFLGLKFLFANRFSVFRTFGMQKDDKMIICKWVF